MHIHIRKTIALVRVLHNNSNMLLASCSILFILIACTNHNVQPNVVLLLKTEETDSGFVESDGMVGMMRTYCGLV